MKTFITSFAIAFVATFAFLQIASAECMAPDYLYIGDCGSNPNGVYYAIAYDTDCDGVADLRYEALCGGGYNIYKVSPTGSTLIASGVLFNSGETRKANGFSFFIAPGQSQTGRYGWSVSYVDGNGDFVGSLISNGSTDGPYFVPVDPYMGMD